MSMSAKVKIVLADSMMVDKELILFSSCDCACSFSLLLPLRWKVSEALALG